MPDPSTERLEAAELFRRHARFVASFALKLGVPAADLDDVVQETFLVAHRKGGFQPGGAKPTTWLAAIAVRVWSTQKRSRRRRPELPLVDADVSTAASEDVFATAAARQALGRLERALSSLDDEHRAIFVLFELEGQSCTDIAQALELPVGTVHSRLFNARKKLTRAYGSERSESTQCSPIGVAT